MLYNAADTFHSSVNHALRQEPTVDTGSTGNSPIPPKTAFPSLLPNTQGPAEPVLPASVDPVQTQPQVPTPGIIESVAPVVPAPAAPLGNEPLTDADKGLGGNDTPAPNLKEDSAFYLLTQALKAKGVFDESFNLESTAEAGAFVDATADYLNQQKEANRIALEAQLRNEYQALAEDIEFRRRGGSPEVLDKLQPLKELGSIDMTQLSQEEATEVKRVTIDQALYLQGAVDPKVREYAIKGYIEDGSFDSKYQESMAGINKYVQDYTAYELQRAEQARLDKEAADQQNRLQYTNSIKEATAKLAKTFKLDQRVASEIEGKIFGNRTEVYKTVDAQGKPTQAVMTPWEVFMTEFYNNPEVQVLAFYNFLNGGSAFNKLKEASVNAVNSDIIKALNERNNGPYSNTPSLQGQSSGEKPIRVLR